MKKKILITGSLGFIGYHLTRRLIDKGYFVVGIDNINTYYDIRMKYNKLPFLGIKEEVVSDNKFFNSNLFSNFSFTKLDIRDREQVVKLFRKVRFDIVVNLAAQAGVQYSMQNPHSYIENNVTGFINLIDEAKANKVKHFIYASSSSVYGDRKEMPFKEDDRVDNPISLYAATKKTNELIAHTYSHLYRMKTTGLRFFTVYGPWGRPDMAPFIFTKNISERKEITVFNKGNLERDFTYVDDIVEGLYNVISKKPTKEYLYNIYNIGNSKPVNLMDFISAIEKKLNKKAIIRYAPLREGDVIKTYASTEKLQRDFNYLPKTDINRGISNFIDWYLDYYNVKKKLV